MQNWDSLPPASYEHNWYGNMFPVKTEPQTSGLAMDHYLGIKQTQAIDMSSLTPSPRMDGGDVHNFLDNGLSAMNNHHPLGFNPLTPPGLPNAVIPSMNFHHEMQQEQNQNQSIQQQHGVHHHNHHHPHNHHHQHNQQSPDVMPKIENNSLTPRNTPPMDVTPPKSPKIQFTTETQEKDNELTSNSSEDTRFLESEDDESIRMPIYNSHGKMKNYKCKHCGFLAITKVSFWNHVRAHMKPEKILQCPKCPFVTELKHHLEYHIRKHKNLKPFQCDKCNYSCVNKSMLNSHLKSHSSVYQYRCADCDYATKYCHSFKLHLRKYDHKPGLVLDEDGAPNPAVVIDVYGTRRGPKMKGGSGRSTKNNKQERKETSTTQLQQQQQQQQSSQSSPVKAQIPPILMGHQQNPISSLLPNTIANMLQQSRNMPFFPYLNLNLQMIAAQHQAVLAQLSPRMRDAALHSLSNLSSGDDQKDNKHEDDDDNDDDEDDENDDRKSESSAMDLSQTTPTKVYPQLQQRDDHELPTTVDEINTPTIASSSSSRRKGRVLKLDSTTLQQANDSPLTTNENHQTKPSMDVDCNNRLTEPKQENTQSDNDDDNDANEQPLSPTSSSFDDQKFNIVSTESADSQSNIAQQQQQQQNQNHHQQQQQLQQMAGIFECKYCDIYFKDAVLYTIHMGYHSCDDVFKCNMCGEKCDGPVGLFVHMARNAHS